MGSPNCWYSSIVFFSPTLKPSVCSGSRSSGCGVEVALDMMADLRCSQLRDGPYGGLYWVECCRRRGVAELILWRGNVCWYWESTSTSTPT